MASFTDTIQEFNPYVQQLPVEAMVEVGMRKQALYDQGYQKIQANIDNVAGMDVIRDVDKAYLQSKLGELKGKLRGVAAGDFSNYQLVNNVGGMINQMGKDKYLQNAVASSSRYRKGVAEMDLARKEGKSSPSNEYVFNREAQKWLNNQDINGSFNGSYKPYTNWKKNGLELLKSLTKDETITDDAFTVDGSGNLVIADATVRKKLAGISPDKIQQALTVGLTPADFEQMGIDGIYSFSNVDDAQFARSIQSQSSSTVGFYEQQRKVLENAKSSTTSVQEKEKLNGQIANIDKIIRNVRTDYADVLMSVQEGNSDAAKAQYYTRNAIDGFAKAFSYTETSQTYETSPFAVAERWRQDKAQDWQKFVLKYEQDEKGLKLKEREVKAKETEVGSYGGLPVGINQADVPRYTLDRVVQETKDKALTVEAVDANFLKSQNKDKAWFDQQKQAWEQSPGSVSPIIKEHFQLTEKMRRDVLSDIVMITDVEKKARETYGDIYQHIPKDAPTLKTYSNGVETSYSPKELVDFNNESANYISQSPGMITSGGTGGKGKTIYDYDRAKAEMSPKMFRLFQIKGGALPANKTVEETLRYYSDTVNQPYSETLNKINKETADEVSKRLTQNQGVAYGIPTGKPDQRSTIATALTQFADLAESTEGGLPNSPNFSVETARQLATEDAKYSLTVVEGTERQPAMYQVNVTGEKGKKTSFRITPEQKNSVFGQMFESSPQVQAVQPYLEQMRKMGGYSTAYTNGPSGPENAYLSKIDFPSANVYGVKGNIVTLSPESGRYTVKLNIFDPVTKTWHNDIDYPRTGMIQKEALNDALRMLNDAAIYELINEKPATANDLKAVENASKKPL